MTRRSPGSFMRSSTNKDHLITATMTTQQEQLLIDHLDNTLTGKGSSETEALIGRSGEMAEQWQYLRLAVDAIQEAGLQEQGAAVGRSWKEDSKVSGAADRTMGQAGAGPARGAVVRPMYKT